MWKEFLADIFGKQIGSHFEHGLVDSSSEAAFVLALENVNLERSCNIIESDPLFHSWFKEHIAEDIVHRVLPEVRRRALFTTNCSESLNNVIKVEVDCHCLWSICNLLEIVKMQSYREQ